MRTHYFKTIAKDQILGRGTGLPYGGYTGWPPQSNDGETLTPVRDSDLTGERLDRALMIERVWSAWYGADYTVGPDFVASWEDRPMGFAMFKVKSINPYLDRCAIENTDEPRSYVLFDLYSKKLFGGGHLFVVYDVHEYHWSDHDETMIRLSI